VSPKASPFTKAGPFSTARLKINPLLAPASPPPVDGRLVAPPPDTDDSNRNGK